MTGIRSMVAAAAGFALLAGTAHAADPFALTSSAFKDGTLLAKKNAGDNKANPNCVGENFRRNSAGQIPRPEPQVSRW